MENVESRWIKLPEVEIDQHQILRVNNRIIDIPDITPQMFADYLELARPLIDSEFRIARQTKRFEFGPHRDTTIYIGRLALIKNIINPSTYDVQDNKGPAALSEESYVADYNSYWEKVRKSLYAPEVYIDTIFEDKKLNGTWLGLHHI